MAAASYVLLIVAGIVQPGPLSWAMLALGVTGLATLRPGG